MRGNWWRDLGGGVPRWDMIRIIIKFKNFQTSLLLFIPMEE
jgi:hypothetical protein